MRLTLHNDIRIMMCKGGYMPTNLALDDKLIENARRIGKHSTKKAVVTEALNEYIQRREQIKILDLFHTVEYDPKYSYKTQRKKT
jgi:Arc/MetJ family transcription regulator